jgi:hypothetical protein
MTRRWRLAKRLANGPTGRDNKAPHLFNALPLLIPTTLTFELCPVIRYAVDSSACASNPTRAEQLP